MDKKPTIVFSRIWTPGRIKIALDCAKKQCPDCRIVHQHDDNSGVGWPDSVNISKTTQVALSIAMTIPESWFSCFKGMQIASLARWKTLLDWMEATEQEEVCFCDSDVLLMSDPFKSPHYTPGRLALSNNHLGCCHAGNSIVNVVAVRMMWARLLSHLKSGKCIPGCMSDMHLWSVIGEEIGYTDQNITKDGKIWDHHMGYLEGGKWEDDGEGYKKLKWKDGQPYCRDQFKEEDVQLINLHCWGNSEAHMEEYANRATL